MRVNACEEAAGLVGEERSQPAEGPARGTPSSHGSMAKMRDVPDGSQVSVIVSRVGGRGWRLGPAASLAVRATWEVGCGGMSPGADGNQSRCPHNYSNSPSLPPAPISRGEAWSAGSLGPGLAWPGLPQQRRISVCP